MDPILPTQTTEPHRPYPTATTPPAAAGRELPRVLGRLQGGEAGPTLICVAGLHGNEPMGVRGLQRALAGLAADPRGFVGTLVGLTGNRRALAAGQRFLSQDLNRIWFADRLDHLRGQPSAADSEDRELLELDGVLRRILESAPGPVYLLDLHTTSAPGPAFGVLEDTLANREFAIEFPVPLVLGIEEELEGTLSNYLCGLGVRTLGFEAGQHREEAAGGRAAGAVWIGLEACGALRGSRAEVAAARRLLREQSRDLPHIVEIRHRHPISPHDRFYMAPGFTGFQKVEEGEPLARDRRGPVLARESALLIMPLYQDQGEDGFFLVRPVRESWLKLSAALRRLRLERHLHHLPGVRRHPERERTFIVDRRVARWLTLEVFHLLGFRRVGPAGRFLIMTRRGRSL